MKLKKIIIIIFLLSYFDSYSQTISDRVYYFSIIELINMGKKIDSVIIKQKVRKTNEEVTDYANENTVFNQNTWKFHLNKWGKLDSFKENNIYSKALYDSMGNHIYGSFYAFGYIYEFILDVKIDSLFNSTTMLSTKDSFKSIIRKYIDSTIITTENYPNYRESPFVFFVYNFPKLHFDFFEWYTTGFNTKTIINHQTNTIIKHIYKEGNFFCKIYIQNYFDKNKRLHKVVYLCNNDNDYYKSNTRKIWYDKNGEVTKIEVLFHGISIHTIERKNNNEYVETVKILDKRMKKYNEIYKKVSLSYKIFS